MGVTEFFNHPVTKNVRRILSSIIWLSLFAGAVNVYSRYIDWDSVNRVEWADKNCPGLLSITRSARDTLNLMRAVEDCNAYVLRTLE